MLDNIDKRLELSDLIALTTYSKYHFIRKYREYTGYTPLQHFEYLKIECAKLMLESSSFSVSEVAFRLGYEDPLYFSRVFRKHQSIS